MANSGLNWTELDWTGLMDYELVELKVGEACACACGGARCQKGVARCEGRRFTSSRLVGG